MKNLIKQDVVRTNQEFEYFKRQATKDLLTNLLYLWGKTYPEYGYKQGMNEILAIILIVCDTERIDTQIDFSAMTDQQIATDHLMEFLFDARGLHADVYMMHSRVLQLGVQLLYQDTKDISALMRELERRNTPEEIKRRELLEFKVSKAVEQKRVRKELEQAYEREKSKVSNDLLTAWLVASFRFDDKSWQVFNLLFSL